MVMSNQIVMKKKKCSKKYSRYNGKRECVSYDVVNCVNRCQ